MEEKKDLEIVSGNGSNLDISPVYEHLSNERPKTTTKKPKNIVIPGKSNKKDKDSNKTKKDA